MEKDSKNGSQEQTDSVPVRRARFQTLTIYEIIEPELQSLTDNPHDSIRVSIATSMITASVSFYSVLRSNLPPSGSNMPFVYIAITVGTGIAGVIMAIMAFTSWRQARRQRSRVVEEIKKRLPPPKPVQQRVEQDEDQQVTLPPKSF